MDLTQVFSDLQEVSDRRTLAEDLGVSPATLSRWVNGRVTPAPENEVALRKLHERLCCQQPRESAQLPLSLGDSQEVRLHLSELLNASREALHRRGRLSSRNEALDEMAKLVVSHVLDVKDGGPGIGGLRGSPEPAEALRAFVDETVYPKLPSSLAHEFAPGDFSLRLKASERGLADELIGYFAELFPAHSSTVELSRADLMNELFGTFLSDSFVDEKELGQYLTPPEVVRSMVAMAVSDLDSEVLAQLTDLDSPGAKLVLDPSCGVGSFLVETLAALDSHLLRHGGPAVATRWLREASGQVLVGIDKSDRMVRLAMAQLAVAGAPTARIHRADGLAREGPSGSLTRGLTGQAGLILTNPPFGAEFSGNDLRGYRAAREWAASPVSRVNSEVLFVERYLEWLTPGGSLLAIVPDSILTNRGVFSDLRKGIGPLVDIRAVISLPSETFGSAGTNTKTSILYLRRRRDRQPASRAFVAVCQDIGYSVAMRGSMRQKVRNGSGDLEQLMADFVRGEPRGDQARLAENLAECDRWDATYHAGLPDWLLRLERRPSAQVLRLRDVATLVDDRYNPSRLGPERFRYIEISDVDLETGVLADKLVPGSEAPSRARKRVKSGDVLVSTVRPDRRAIGVVGAHQDGAICSTGFAVLRPEVIDSTTLAHLLKTDAVAAQLMRHNLGIAYPAIAESVLPDIILPITLDQAQSLDRLGATLAEATSRLRQVLEELKESLGVATAEWEATVSDWS